MYTMQNWMILHDVQQSSFLQLEPAATIDTREPAATVDAGEPLVKATYHLERDGLLAFDSYEIMATVHSSKHNNHHPNATAVAWQLSPGNSVAMNQIVQYALSCIQPGLQYFTIQLGHSLRDPLTAFKAARFLNQQKVAEMLPTALDVEDLAFFLFVYPVQCVLISKLNGLPMLLKQMGVIQTFAIFRWWKNYFTTLPHGSALARQALSV